MGPRLPPGVYRARRCIAERFPHVPRIALTATADDTDAQEIVARLGLDDAPSFIASFDRPNIRYQIVEKHNAPAPAAGLHQPSATRATPASSIACRATRSRTPPRR